MNLSMNDMKVASLVSLEYKGSNLCIFVGLKYYKSDKTFRRGTVWISDLDLGVVSSSVSNSMLEFKVDRNMAFRI